MRAIVIDPAVPHALRLSGGPEPIPSPGQVLIDVRHVSLNPAEVHMVNEGALPAGLVPGWEAAGVVIATPGSCDPTGFATPGGVGPRHGVSGSGRNINGPGRNTSGPGRGPGALWRVLGRGANGFGSLAGGLGSGLNAGAGPAATNAGTFGYDGVRALAKGRPNIGDRVVTRGRVGGWAERRAVDVDNVAIVPDGVDLAAAAALPVAASTALGALEAAGPTIGRRVLITGAAGGVGRFAVQLAALGGAYVIASVGSQARGEGLRELGAHEVVVGLKGITDQVDVVLDGVGGAQMVEAFGLLAPGGGLQSYGWISDEPAVFPPYSTVGPARTLTSFSLPPAAVPGLTTLLDLVAAGRLKVEIGWRGSWERYDEAIDALLGRRVNGKAVLDVS